MDKTAPVRATGTPVPTLEEDYTNQKRKGIKKSWPRITMIDPAENSARRRRTRFLSRQTPNSPPKIH